MRLNKAEPGSSFTAMQHHPCSTILNTNLKDVFSKLYKALLAQQTSSPLALSGLRNLIQKQNRLVWQSCSEAGPCIIYSVKWDLDLSCPHSVPEVYVYLILYHHICQNPPLTISRPFRCPSHSLPSYCWCLSSHC